MRPLMPMIGNTSAYRSFSMNRIRQIEARRGLMKIITPTAAIEFAFIQLIHALIGNR
jgi:hypothetical protein